VEPGLVSQIIPDFSDPDAALPLDLTIKLSRSGNHGFSEKEKYLQNCLKVGSEIIILDPDSGMKRIRIHGQLWQMPPAPCS
jgi:hypothetical protein